MNADLVELQQSVRQVLAGARGGRRRTGRPGRCWSNWAGSWRGSPRNWAGWARVSRAPACCRSKWAAGSRPCPSCLPRWRWTPYASPDWPIASNGSSDLTGGEYVAAPLAECALSLEPTGAGNARLTGLASGVPSADRASHALVWTRAGDCVALVPLDRRAWRSSSVRLGPDASPVRPALRGHWNSTSTLVLARGAAAQALIRRLSALRDLGLAADAVGGANALLELTVEHLQVRRQFGRPLALVPGAEASLRRPEDADRGGRGAASRQPRPARRFHRGCRGRTEGRDGQAPGVLHLREGGRGSAAAARRASAWHPSTSATCS